MVDLGAQAKLARTLQDDAADRAFNEDGYLHLPFLQPDAVDDLLAALRRFDEWGDGFASSVERIDSEFRMALHELLTDAFAAPAADLLDDHRPFMSAMVVKFPGPASVKNVHQDWSLVDEATARAVNCWVPLIDTDMRNGAIAVLPGSHRVLDRLRPAPRFPTGYHDPIADVDPRALLPVPMRAGDVFLHDLALVHASPANLSTEPRVAVAVTYVPRPAKVYFHFCGADDRIERFTVDDTDFFRRFDWQERPTELEFDSVVEFTAPAVDAQGLLERTRGGWTAPDAEPSRPLDEIAPAALPVPPLPRRSALQRILRRTPVAPQPSAAAGRRRTFTATSLQAEFDRSGFVVLPLLDESARQQLTLAYADIGRRRLEDSVFADGFHTTIYDDRPEYRQLVIDAVAHELDSALSTVLDDHRIFLASFTVKDPLGATVPDHLDWTFVDEGRFTSATVWCPLHDVRPSGGPIGVIVGSHQRVDFVRPANFRDYDHHSRIVADLERRVVPLRAGEAIIWDNRLVHFSEPNQTDETRLAVSCITTPREASLEHFWAEEDGRLVKLEVDADFYLHYAPGQYPFRNPGIMSSTVVDAAYA